MATKLEWKDIGKSGKEKVLSPAFTYQGMVYTSGHVGHYANDVDSFPGTIEEQTEYLIKNLEKTLKACAAELDSCVKLLVFIKNPADLPAMNKVYGKYFTIKPARSCVAVNFPHPKILVEMEAVAIKVNCKSKSKL